MWLRITPETGDPRADAPTHAGLDWRDPTGDEEKCGGGLTFAFFPLKK